MQVAPQAPPLILACRNDPARGAANLLGELHGAHRGRAQRGDGDAGFYSSSANTLYVCLLCGVFGDLLSLHEFHEPRRG